MELCASTAGIFDSELFEKISNSKSRIPSEAKREAWIADTILLLASELGEDSVLSGGSAVRNITRVMRSTYDVDFDTEISSLQQMRQSLKDVNKQVQLKKTNKVGAVYENPERNNVKTFYGERKMLHLLRTTDAGSIKVHIIHAPEMPEMFTDPPRLELVSIETTDRKVSNARAEHIFFRKCIRANTEKRVEDFLDTHYILQSAGAWRRRDLIPYAKAKDAKAVANGLKILASDPQSYIPQLDARLTYMENDRSTRRLKEIAYSISQELVKVAAEIG
jgi:hypothetical protein